MSRVSFHSNAGWWRGAAIYQVYVRSFADGDGDGIGDLAGIRERLGYLADLGVDALWLTPFYPSPMADAGYDVADYRDVDPVFGTLAEADALIAEAHAKDIKIIIDVVPNHCSDAHRWFRAALAAGPGSPERARFWFRRGRGEHGDLPPNDWQSIFGGPAWTRTADPAGEWYLHLFAPEQPDFNWTNPDVHEEFAETLRFWLDRGVDGFRIDSAALLVKDPALPDLQDLDHDPYTDLDGVHEIYRSWRQITDEYPDRVLIGEVWLPDAQRFVRYLRPDELNTAFNFDFLCCAWDADRLREVIDTTLAVHRPVDAPATWVLSNHDVTRHVSRYGRENTAFFMERRDHESPVDLELGTRRARAAALLTMALPGSVYVYQGEELGLWEVEDIPDELRQDPLWQRSGRTDPGRDGCRVPLPWSGAEPPFGFTPPTATADPWLPQPYAWKDRTVEAETGDPHSMLELYRTALSLRHDRSELGDGAIQWQPADPGVLFFNRGSGFSCIVNLSPHRVALPATGTPILTSGPLDGDFLPPDTAAWLTHP